MARVGAPLNLQDACAGVPAIAACVYVAEELAIADLVAVPASPCV